jgi:hypothetical protein
LHLVGNLLASVFAIACFWWFLKVQHSFVWGHAEALALLEAIVAVRFEPLEFGDPSVLSYPLCAETFI